MNDNIESMFHLKFKALEVVCEDGIAGVQLAWTVTGETALGGRDISSQGMVFWSALDG
uniref:Uncharacterized protein n=1 Tax=Arion vulgaris TaxID=1028688 RepID=A0A0B6ZZL6_9EUPU